LFFKKNMVFFQKNPPPPPTGPIQVPLLYKTQINPNKKWRTWKFFLYMGHYVSHENHLMAKHKAMQEMEYRESLIHFSEGSVANKK